MLDAPRLQRLKNPEYTGENRCGACTIVNAIIVVALGAALALAVSPVVGAVAVAAGAAAVYARGYVVPGTPTLTQHLPDRVLAWFDHHEVDTAVPDEAPTAGASDPERILREAGAVVDCPEADDLCLDDGFRSAWYEEMAAIRAEESVTDLIRDAVGADATVTERGDELYAQDGGRVVGQWVSRTAAVADFAADRALADRVPRWDDAPVARRSVVTRGLRPFLDRCPDCDDHVAAEKVTSCCISGRAQTVVHCPNCDTVLFESEPYTDLPEPGA